MQDNEEPKEVRDGFPITDSVPGYNWRDDTPPHTVTKNKIKPPPPPPPPPPSKDDKK